MDDAVPGSGLDRPGPSTHDRRANSPDDADGLYHQFPSQEAQYLSTPGRSQAGSWLRLMSITADSTALVLSDKREHPLLARIYRAHRRFIGPTVDVRTPTSINIIFRLGQIKHLQPIPTRRPTIVCTGTR